MSKGKAIGWQIASLVGIVAIVASWAVYNGKLGAAWSAKWGSGEGNGGPSTAELPFGQFPVARIGIPEFMKVVNLPPPSSKDAPTLGGAFSRTHGSFVLFNALGPAYNCKICKPVEDDFWTVAEQISPKERIEKKILFATVDLDQSRDLFRTLRLETAPILIYFPPSEDGKPLASHKVLDYRKAITIETMTQFIYDNAKIAIKSDGPWKKVGSTIAPFGLLLGIASLVASRICHVWFRKSLLHMLFYNVYFWAVVATSFVLLMTSGHQWVQIRNAPYISMDPNHAGQTDSPIKMLYLAPSMQQQFGIETQLVSLLNGAGAIAISLLTIRIPKVHNDRLRRILVYVCSAVLVGSFAVELALFRYKQPGYPFRFVL